MDKATIDRIALLHPKVRAEVGNIYIEICRRLSGRAMCRFAYTLRTWAEQDALYAQGRTTSGKIVTNAKGGESFHNYGLAVDIVLIVDKDKNGSYESASWETSIDFDGDGTADWQEVVQVFKMHGWEWGGSWAKFPDYPHFQKSFGYSVMDLKNAVNSGKTINGYVNI